MKLTVGKPIKVEIPVTLRVMGDTPPELAILVGEWVWYRPVPLEDANAKIAEVEGALLAAAEDHVPGPQERFDNYHAAIEMALRGLLVRVGNRDLVTR